jgi:hypothetical protein
VLLPGVPCVALSTCAVVANDSGVGLKGDEVSGSRHAGPGAGARRPRLLTGSSLRPCAGTGPGSAGLMSAAACCNRDWRADCSEGVTGVGNAGRWWSGPRTTSRQAEHRCFAILYALAPSHPPINHRLPRCCTSLQPTGGNG